MNNFIPRKRGKIAIIDGRAPEEVLTKLKALNLEVIPTIKCRELYDSISYHPDIVLHPVGEKEIVVAPNVYRYYKKQLAPLGINIIKGSTFLGNKYPENISYNVGRIGNHYIHNLKYTDKVLKEIFEEKKIRAVDIKQGYSKCSLGLFSNESGITSDKPMYKKLVNLGYDILYVEPKDIELPGENYGFIGGSMGNLDEDTILFTGSLNKYKNGNIIKDYLKDKNKRIIELSEKEIIDLGSIIIF